MENPEWWLTDYTLDDVDWEPVEQWGGTVYGLGSVKENGGHVAVFTTGEHVDIQIGAYKERATACLNAFLIDSMMTDPGPGALIWGSVHLCSNLESGRTYIFLNRGDEEHVLKGRGSYAEMVIEAARLFLEGAEEGGEYDNDGELEPHESAERKVGEALRKLRADGLICVGRATEPAVSMAKVAKALKLSRTHLDKILAGNAWT
ncbi:hypothetical protein AB0D27_19135 [Streptomyces sp. NPDC048415]|uniref:hypothetical protein n=1 Tax=Streptomyces sp. NPDC048415 TaxID=3154822 RepID=UPI003415FA8D